MSQRSMFTRGMTGAVAVAGALALSLPGVANAAPQAKPTVSATASGGKITINVEPPVGVDCTPSASVLSPIDALPLVAGKVTDLTKLPTSLGGTLTKGEGNTWTTERMSDGIYVAVGTCESAEEKSLAYTFAFLPGNILGTIPQFLNLGSTVLTMDGGMELIMQLLSSDMLGGGSDEPAAPGDSDTGEGEPATAGPLDGFDLGSLAAMFGGGDAGAGGETGADVE